MSGGNVVDLGQERLKRKARDLYVDCPRCGKKVFMRHTRCQHCGLWFSGEAFQFAPGDYESAEGESRGRRVLKRLCLLLLLVLGLLACLGLVAFIL